jgi:hypothetical protein
VKPKEIGAFVSDLFVETRARVRGMIESQLNELANSDDSVRALHLSEEMSSFGSQPLVLTQAPTSVSQSVAISSAPVEILGNRRTQRRAPWPLIVAMIAGLAAAGLVAATHFEGAANQASSAAVAPHPERTPPAPSPPVPSLPSPSTPPAANAAEPSPAVATIRFGVQPPNARLWLDGVALPAESRARALPANGMKHTLRAEAQGHDPREVEFTATQDLSLEIALPKTENAQLPVGRRRASPSPAPAAKAAVSAPRPAVSAPQPEVSSPKASESEPAKPACTDPFFIAEGGIKRVRPECR